MKYTLFYKEPTCRRPKYLKNFNTKNEIPNRPFSLQRRRSAIYEHVIK